MLSVQLKETETLLQKILVVEDSKMFCSLLSRAFESELGIEPTVFMTLRETVEHLEVPENNQYFAALLDLNLPDAPQGEVVDYVVSKKIPSIVFTGEISEEVRQLVWSKRIVDYISKDNANSIEQIISLVRRLKKNRGIKILVVDDSLSSRNILGKYLETWNFSVEYAKDGSEALDILKEDGNFKMVICDNYMPNMDGLTLTKEIRRTHSKSRIPIIGMSGKGGATTSAYFLKAGANDYIHKPFLAEELYCRVTHNIENAEYISIIRDMAEKDFLTKIYNRRSFFNYAEKLFSSMRRGHLSITIAMMDIDHFKRCNDTYGHDAGDKVICFVANTLKKRFRNEDVVARFGGEEFCVCGVNMDAGQVSTIFNSLREQIEKSVISSEKDQIQITVSIGVCTCPQDSLSKMIERADEMLYKAKNSGRNQVQIISEV